MAEIFKLRNLSDEVLQHEERQAAEQLFRLRFQMKLGQNEGAKKMRELRKDIARIKTVRRERELGLVRGEGVSSRKPGTRLSDRTASPTAAEGSEPAAKVEAGAESGE